MISSGLLLNKPFIIIRSLWDRNYWKVPIHLFTCQSILSFCGLDWTGYEAGGRELRWCLENLHGNLIKKASVPVDWWWTGAYHCYQLAFQSVEWLRFFLRGWDHSSGIFNRNIIEKIKRVEAETQIHGWDCDKGNQFDSLDSSLIFQECGYFRLGASW